MTDPLFELSGEVEETIPFTVRGELYQLRTISHLNKLEEAHVRSMTKLEQHYVRQINDLDATDTARVEALNLKLIDLRGDLIEMMTSVPREVIDKLSTPEQVKLTAYIGTEAARLRELLVKAADEARKAAAEQAEAMAE